MPELPEAETIARSLAPRIAGRAIRTAAFLAKRVSRDKPARLIGLTIAGVRRYGKQLLIEFSAGAGFLHVKLGMTGALLVNGERGTHTRAVFDLTGGVRLQFDDIRQFGSLRFVQSAPTGAGPDPFEISAADFAARIATRRGSLKTLLLNQGFLRGLGNIYVDEALFRAHLHPLTRVERLGKDAALLLHRVIVELLNEAILHRGSSISDYVDASGERGRFQEMHRVYGKTGEPCAECGKPIVRIVVAQRGTHFCPACQPAKRSSAATTAATAARQRRGSR